MMRFKNVIKLVPCSPGLAILAHKSNNFLRYSSFIFNGIDHLQGTKFKEESKWNSARGYALAASLGVALMMSHQSYNDKRFFRAAQLGNVEEIKRLCIESDDKVNVDVRHNLGWTALMAAAANGQTAVVSELLKLGAKPDLQEQYSNPHIIGRKKGLHPIDVLTIREEEFCESMNGRATFKGFTALHYAALADSHPVAKVLLDAGADCSVRDHAGRRPIDYAQDPSKTKSLLAQATQQMEIKIQEKLAEERRRFPLEQRLKQFIVGQQGAINNVAAAVRRKENGWADDEHPLVFLFLGSSGIGKTELAKQLAKYIHKDNPQAFIRLDMSEYQEKHEVAKLIGAPPGYIGHEDGGQLTKHLAKQPNAVVLFDEVDKAHPDVLTVLLQLFDEGRITDGKGRLIECKNAIFVMTSNLAAEEIAEYGIELRKEAERVSEMKMTPFMTAEDINEENLVEVSRHFKDSVVRPILKKHFCRDEFLGRINEIVYFLPFSRQELLTLVSMELNLWAKKALSRHSVELAWESGVLGCLADGYDVHYGARSIKHEVERRVVNQIALAAEKGLLGRGACILVTSTDGKININVKGQNEKHYKVVA